MRRASLLAAVVAALAGCSSPPPDPIVDGWPIGPALECSVAMACSELLAEAEGALDRRDPGHPAISSVTLHREGSLIRDDGTRFIVARTSPCCDVARFVLADGSVAAIGVGWTMFRERLAARDYGP